MDSRTLYKKYERRAAVCTIHALCTNDPKKKKEYEREAASLRALTEHLRSLSLREMEIRTK